jgi:hypothetical protein
LIRTPPPPPPQQATKTKHFTRESVAVVFGEKVGVDGNVERRAHIGSRNPTIHCLAWTIVTGMCFEWHHLMLFATLLMMMMMATRYQMKN